MFVTIMTSRSRSCSERCYGIVKVKVSKKNNKLFPIIAMAGSCVL